MATLNLFILMVASLLITGNAVQLRDRNKKPYRMVCYFGAWAGYRHGDGTISPEDFDPHACTHLIYAFAVLEGDKITPHDTYLDLEEDWGKGFYSKFNALRKKNSELTTLIAIGGWREGELWHNHKYSNMAKDPARRKVFVDSVVEFLKKHDFDGLDFDWEYPVLREGVLQPEDKVNYVILLKELKKAFEPHGYLLTAAVAAGKTTIEAGYDIPQVSKYLDIINIMTYDFNGAWSSITGHNSPLYARPQETGDARSLNVDYAIKHWIKEGADKKKITMGMALYGRCFKLADRRKTGYGAPAADKGLAGPFTQEPGFMGYNELCWKDKTESGWNTVLNEFHLAPYMYRGDQWCSYDDANSLAVKVNYLKAMGLSGAMVWSLDTDDFKGRCSNKKSPLVSSIVDALKSKKVPELPSTPRWTPEDPTPSGVDTEPYEEVTIDPQLVGLCKAEGLVQIPNECSKFGHCVPDGDGYRLVEKDCAPGTVFNPRNKRCDHPANVPGC